MPSANKHSRLYSVSTAQRGVVRKETTINAVDMYGHMYMMIIMIMAMIVIMVLIMMFAIIVVKMIIMKFMTKIIRSSCVPTLISAFFGLIL